MDIGRLDRRVTIQYYTETTDQIGGVVQTWADLATVWATITYPKGLASKEGAEIAKETAITPVEIWIRYRTGIDETMRVDYKGEYYYITRVNYQDRGTSIKLVTEKRV